jgi:dihydroceramidase
MNATNYLSSSIDWCEANFEHSTYIIEYWNSYTSLVISTCGVVGIYFHPEAYILYITLVPIGLTSFYFHATLSLIAQVLDELSIVMSLIISLHYINVNIYRFCNTYFLLLVNGAQIVLIVTFPDYNRLILFLYGFYIWNFLRHVKKMLDGKKLFYVFVSEILFFLSVISWIIDYVFCIQAINFHALWHILIGCMGYYIFKALYILRDIRDSGLVSDPKPSLIGV